MIEKYIAYKTWWYKYQAQYSLDHSFCCHTEEEAFEQHVKDMGLYNLMETLSNWD